MGVFDTYVPACQRKNKYRIYKMYNTYVVRIGNGSKCLFLKVLVFPLDKIKMNVQTRCNSYNNK